GCAMTEAVTVPTTASRSLWQDAWLRLRKNRAAVASMIVLVALALAGIFGPMVSPHRYSTIYQQYVRVAPSLEAYPKAEQIMPGFEREMRRARLTGAEPVLDGETLSVELTADEPIDERVTRYFARSDLFTNPQLDLAPDGMSGTLERKSVVQG